MVRLRAQFNLSSGAVISTGRPFWKTAVVRPQKRFGLTTPTELPEITAAINGAISTPRQLSADSSAS